MNIPKIIHHITPSINKIESAYIITIKNHPTSERLAKRCYDSCVSVNMPVKYWEAFDGTIENKIKFPSHIKKSDIEYYCNFKNILNMTVSELACFYSHLSLWKHCVNINKPIVIFEHDAIMMEKITYNHHEDSIIFLGHYKELSPWCKVLLMQIDTREEIYTKNFMLNGAHAYSIHPKIAAKMIDNLKFAVGTDRYIIPNKNVEINDAWPENIKLFFKQGVFKTDVVYDKLYAYQLIDETTIDHS
jgi:GR25 family glycosyltransferase involved in LPS biosynthesis